MNTMRQQQELLQSYLKQAKVSLSKKPQGILSTSYSHHCIQFCWKSSPSDQKWVYLPKKETKLIQALAQKDYDTRFIKTAEKLAKTTDWIIRIGAERDIHYFYQALAQVYTDLPEARRQFVIPYVLPDDLYVAAWKDVKYEGKGFWDDDPIHRTDNGERVRSKSEKMIADRLLTMNIPYRYEYPLSTKALGTIYPDFTLLDVWSRREVILEHFGLMGDPDYCDRMIRKYYTYIQEGYALGIDFLFTMETANHPLNTQYFESMIRNRFLHTNI